MKKNILFGKEFDPQLFRRVVRATALDAVCIDVLLTIELMMKSWTIIRILLNWPME